MRSTPSARFGRHATRLSSALLVAAGVLLASASSLAASDAADTDAPSVMDVSQEVDDGAVQLAKADAGDDMSASERRAAKLQRGKAGDGAAELEEDKGGMDPLWMGLGSAGIFLLPINFIAGPFVPVVWAIEAAALGGLFTDFSFWPMLGAGLAAGTVGFFAFTAVVVASIAASVGTGVALGGAVQSGLPADVAGTAAQAAGGTAFAVAMLGGAAAVGLASAGGFWAGTLLMDDEPAPDTE